jgi:hypothetical protein
MKTINKKIAGIVFTETGVMIEKPYCENNSEPRPRIKEEKFTGELLDLAKIVVKYRMADCYKKLHSNLANAKVITSQSIIWQGGHFEIPVWEQMEAVLNLDDIRKLNRMQCQQIIRSLMFNTPSYWLQDHDENWNLIKDSKDIKLTDEFKLVITELILVNSENIID